MDDLALLHALLPRVRCPDHGVRQRSAETVARFAADLTEHGCDPEKVTDTSSDMSTAFISGIRAHLPNARMTFDRYHLAAKLSEAIDTGRREEVVTAGTQTHPLAVAEELPTFYYQRSTYRWAAGHMLRIRR